MTRDYSPSKYNIIKTDKFFTNYEKLFGEIEIRYHITSEKKLCLSLLETDQLTQLLELKNWLNQFLSEGEKKIFARLHHTKRKRDWLGGRLAIKHAVGHWQRLSEWTNDIKYSSISVTPLASGRPSITIPQGLFPGPGISISHSGKFAVGLASLSTTCGIDIQVITTRVLNIKDRFSSPDEIRIIQENSSIDDVVEQYVLLWSAKEAVKKGLLHDQLSLFSGITLQGFRQDDNNILLMTGSKENKELFEVHALKIDNYYLAYTTGASYHAGTS